MFLHRNSHQFPFFTKQVGNHPMPQTPEYTVRLRTPHEHQREKETPEPLTSAGAAGKGRMPMWRRTSTLYTVDEAARILRLPPGRIRQMLRAGELEGL
jgi:hypothetical protein